MKEKNRKKVERFAEIYMPWGLFATLFIGPPIATLIIMIINHMILKDTINIVVIFLKSFLVVYVLNCVFLSALILGGAIKVTKRGVYYIRHCDIAFFEEIDRYKYSSYNRMEAHERAYRMINLYYKKNGKQKSRVMEYAEKEGLKDLYIRKDFLEKNINFTPLMITYLIGLIVGLIQSIFVDAIEQSIWGVLISMAVGLILLFCVIFCQYSSRGQMGSFDYEVAEYECKLLDEVIQAEKEKRVMSSEKEYLINMQQVLIEALRNYKKTWKVKLDSAEKEKVESDLKEVEELKLYDESNYAMIAKKEYRDCTIGYSDYRNEIGRNCDDNCQLRKLYIKYEQRCKLPELSQFKDVETISCCETDHHTG